VQQTTQILTTGDIRTHATRSIIRTDIGASRDALRPCTSQDDRNSVFICNTPR